MGGLLGAEVGEMKEGIFASHSAMLSTMHQQRYSAEDLVHQTHPQCSLEGWEAVQVAERGIPSPRL